MKNLKSFIIGSAAFLLIISCNNNDEDSVYGGNLDGSHVSAVIELDHSLAIGDEFTVKKSAEDIGETLILDEFKFLVSDFSLKNEANEMISIPNNLGGNLIDLSKADNKVVKIYLSGLPKGIYKSISFGIGVSQEVAGGSADAQKKLFDLATEDMSWNWNPNSYIFSKIEATNKLNMMHHMEKLETEQADNLWIHIGKKGDFDGFRMVTLDFPENITVKTEVSPSLHVKVSVEKLFAPDNGTNVYLEAPSKPDFADNYINIFEVHHVHPLDEALKLEDVMHMEHHSEGENSEHNH